jgi:hypothetical protein
MLTSSELLPWHTVVVVKSAVVADASIGSPIRASASVFLIARISLFSG